MAFGDRKDGKYLRKLNPYYALTPFIMNSRDDSMIFFEDSIEITNIERYLRRKRLEGMKGLGYLHLFIAAYIRVICSYPAVNRFVVGQRVYAANEIVFVMSIKRELTIKGEETSIKVRFSPGDTISDVYHKLQSEISHTLDGADTSTDNTARAVIKLPRIILKFFVWLMRTLDYFGKMPKAIVEASPFHGSFIITDSGSITLPPVYHHLYNFGTLPVFISFGVKRTTYEMQSDSTIQKKKYMDYKITTDERICDGFYYAMALKAFKNILRHPETLDSPPEVILTDPDI